MTTTNGDGDILIEEQHPISKRWAIFEDDGVAAYLYITERGIRKPLRDCWIYNRILAPVPGGTGRHLGGPPPACLGYAGDSAQLAAVEPADVQFVWSPSGDSVAVTVGGTALAFVTSRLNDGFSRNIIKPGPWGMPWDEQLYRKELGIG